MIYFLFLLIFPNFGVPNRRATKVCQTTKITNYCAYDEKKQENFSKGGTDDVLCHIAVPVVLCAGLVERLRCSQKHNLGGEA